MNRPSRLESGTAAAPKARLASTSVSNTMAAVLSLGLMLSLPAAWWLEPTRSTASLSGPIALDQQVPARFAQWREDPSLRPILPDPQLQATLASAYSQVLARTYINDLGQRVMLSIAYGNDQNSEASAVHRPEFCYRSQGFSVQGLGQHALVLPTHTINTEHLVARIGSRVEPILYWITLDQEATLPGLGRKLQQFRYGLRGLIADGMVVRVSAFGPPDAQNYALLQTFAQQMFEATAPEVRSRYFGGGLAP